MTYGFLFLQQALAHITTTAKQRTLLTMFSKVKKGKHVSYIYFIQTRTECTHFNIHNNTHKNIHTPALNRLT